MDTIKLSQRQQKKKASEFKNIWLNKGNEKSDTQAFWNSLLRDVFGVTRPEESIEFEKPVVIENKSFIDAYIKDTKVLIEQKSYDIDLRKSEKQSDGSYLTPYEQAKRYANDLPNKDKPDWIIVCNFREFIIYDENKVKYKRGDTREENNFLLEELDKYYYLLDFLVNTHKRDIIKETEVSKEAGLIVGKIYDSLVKQYLYINEKDDNNKLTSRAIHEQQSLNRLCVRLVFCFYAEDSGLFRRKNQFHDYLDEFSAGDLRGAIKRLFDILNTPEENRDPYASENLLEFPYVNGGLFDSDNLVIPQFSVEIKDILVNHASSEFDWSAISPTIFGAVFESTLNPETRRQGGMHYTSIENIHNVIDPLFLDELKDELKGIKLLKQFNTIEKKVTEFQNKLASLKFLDPACGSGNFLTETYISLRKLENEALEFKLKGNMMLDFKEDSLNPIKVSINQFYGIEINDFAVTVGKTALWIAEHQMIKETENIIAGLTVDFLPLHTFAKIVEGNALRMDWNDVVPSAQLNYIMSNPPFIGARLMSPTQKEEVALAFKDVKNSGNIDYVGCWYAKSCEYMKGTDIQVALVSTNSICQGEQPSILWKPLMDAGITINYAYRTFIWDSEATVKAHVHCVIVGFGYKERQRKRIYENGDVYNVKNINAYLVDAPNIFIDSRSKPLYDVPNLVTGCQRLDGNHFMFTKEEMDDFIKEEPLSAKYFRRWYGADEFINSKERYCLYLAKCEPSELRKMPKVIKILEEVRKYRETSNREQTKKYASMPNKFYLEVIPEHDYILVPVVSSERRQYIPMGFMSNDVLCSNQANMIPDAEIVHFGILESNVHMAWMRTVAGRLKSDYRYSKDIVYNNFIWPNLTGNSKRKIEITAQDILDARKLYPNSTLADLYDDLTMPTELRKAHEANDKAVMDAYGFKHDISEEDIVAELMKLYQVKVNNQ